MENRIKALRLEHDMSQRALASFIGCSQKSIEYWEKGISEPTSGFICALADCFACTTDYLLGREDEFGVVSVNPELSERYKDILRIYTALPKEKQDFLYDFAVFLYNYKK